VAVAATCQRSFDDPDAPLSQVTFVVVDVETTGGSPATSSLTEVAAAKYRSGELLGTFETFVRPDQRIPPMITALTGISDVMVADAPRVGEMLPSFLEFVGGAVLVGHNLRFDLSFLDHALVSTGRDRLHNSTVDTLALARRLVRDLVPDCRLGTLAASLRLAHTPAHRALADVLATGDLLHAMLERAGSYGILGLEEFLDLPRLIGHPQAAKLRLTTRLPHRLGVFWLTNAAGHVVYVGKATDLRDHVRSYFAAEKRSWVGRLLRQVHAIDHRVCPDPLTATVIEGRLIRAWSPQFNQPGRRRATNPKNAVRISDRDLAFRRPTTAGIRPRRKSKRGLTWSDAELDADPYHLLAPMAERLTELSNEQRFEEAATMRDEAERLRQLLVTHRNVKSLSDAGRVTLMIDGEHPVELARGLLVCRRKVLATGSADYDRGCTVSVESADDDNERMIVANWIAENSARVRILEVESDVGISVPSGPVPVLTELCDPGHPPPGDDQAGSAA
jgi:DNA polymerase III epsilon subunit family exonuclease